jgi:hypothetical protein
MGKATKRNHATDRPKAQGQRDKPRATAKQTTANRRLSEQTRKILGKHYASKYRVR